MLLTLLYQLPAITGALATREVGSDVVTITGLVVSSSPVTGSLAAREVGADFAVFSGLVIGELRRAGPVRSGEATPQFVRPSPALSRRPRPPQFRRLS